MTLRADRHQRFHILLGRKRTTVSLNGCLAALLALRLGEDPEKPNAVQRVRAWLQERTAEDSNGAGLNRRLIRRALLEVADKDLSRRCAAWMGQTAPAPARVPRSRTAPAAASENRFVLYRAITGLPPDIVARGASPEETRFRAGEIYAEDDAHPNVLKASLITTEKERHGRYYIRRCSEDCWAALTGERNIHPLPDADGVWRTRAETARLKKENVWRNALDRMARPRRRTG